MEQDRIRLVYLRGIYAFYDINDHAYEHVLSDPDARVVTLSEFRAPEPEPPLDAEVVYNVKGHWPPVLATLFLKQKGSASRM